MILLTQEEVVKKCLPKEYILRARLEQLCPMDKVEEALRLCYHLQLEAYNGGRREIQQGVISLLDLRHLLGV